jgi:hypothetical protein
VLAEATASATEVAPPPAAARDPAALLHALATSMRPTAGEGLLLLGLHLEKIEGYFPMFSNEGKPRTNVAPGYRTILLHTKDGAVTVANELGYLALPKGDGVLFVGESSVSIHEPEDPRDTNGIGVARPHDYDATEIWTAKRRADVDATARAVERKLRARKKWGTENTEQLVYITPRARCRATTWTMWTGGAAWFDGETSYAFDAVTGPRVDDVLAHYVDDPTLRRFAGLAFASDEDDAPEIDLDAPYEDWGRHIAWRKDAHVCLARARGKVQLVGTVLRAGNTHRSFTAAVPLQPAPVELAPVNAHAVDFDAVEAAFPGATDAWVSPARDVALVVQGEKLVVYDALHEKPGQNMPFTARVVMAEWASGERASALLAALAR